jgi:hypothetical protein
VPFRHPDRSHDLDTRIEMEVRERLEEAVDYVCLEALVRARRAAGLPPPAADSAADKRAYTDNVLSLLRRLHREVAAELSADQQRKVDEAASVPGDEPARLMAAQVILARLLPDYWAQFEGVSARYLDTSADGSTTASGGEGRGLLGRLFGRR